MLGDVRCVDTSLLWLASENGDARSRCGDMRMQNFYPSMRMAETHVGINAGLR